MEWPHRHRRDRRRRRRAPRRHRHRPDRGHHPPERPPPLRRRRLPAREQRRLGHLGHRRHREDQRGARQAEAAPQHLHARVPAGRRHGRRLPPLGRRGRGLPLRLRQPLAALRPIDGFFKAANFPPGSLHLKQFRWKDSSFFSLFQDPVAYKKPILAALLTRFPGRRFVLVGDSGEQDPEVYGIIYREFPDQVAAIYIRDVTAEPREAARYTAAFAEVPGDRWTLFTDPATLPATLPAGPAGAP
ncbi:MAG: App1 family protein [Nannocystis sp.]|nr:App1 family protein [Nannocystis sp.]MBK9756150.1 App1 family protein [Nannocystis sp.]